MNRFEQELLESPSLPRVPAQARLLLELLASDESAAAVELIEQDPTLEARVLALVNSKRSDVARLQGLDEARALAGERTLACTALAASLMAGLRDALGRSELLDRLFRSLLMTGLAARSLALEVSSWDPGEALLAGMLEKTGALLLYDQRAEYPRLIARYVAGEGDLAELEREQLGSDHGCVTSALLEHWGLPGGIRDALCARFAVDRARSQEPAMSRGRILTGASLYGRALTIDGFVHEVESLERRVADLVRIPPVLAGRIAVELPRQLRRVGSLLGVDCESQPGYEELRSEAGELLTEDALDLEPATPIPIRTPGQANRSREFEDLLRAGVSSLPVDPETGHFDLTGFERMLSAFVDRAQQLDRPLSVLVIGVRDLRGIAERLGEHVARELLGSVSQRVADLVRRSDPKGRLSDSHVGVIAPGCSERDLPRLAERIRWAVSREPLETRSGPVRCELSIGMASVAPRHACADPQQLMGSAWSALDEAALCGSAVALGA